jgi:hypothetical protein
MLPIDYARTHAEYALAEVIRDVENLLRGRTTLTTGDVRLLEQSWKRAVRPVEDLLFTLGLDPTANGPILDAVQRVHDELSARIAAERARLAPCIAPGSADPPQTSADAGANARAERGQRMAAFRQGKR